MLKLLIFDLDGTLCGIGEPVLAETLDRLRVWESEGKQLVICSGKPTYYLCGLARQLGLKNLIMAGENGVVIQFGVNLPPREVILDFPKKDIDALDEIRARVKEEFGDKVWLQPNTVALTCFFRDERDKEDMRNFLKGELSARNTSIQLFDQTDCFDLNPDLNKGDAVRFLLKELGLKKEEAAAVGDGTNDYPMFAEVGMSIGIGMPMDGRIRHRAKDIGEALDMIESEMNSQSEV